LKIFTVSVDSHFTHHAWRNTLVSDGGIGKVRYTMVADINHGITQAYGVESASGVVFDVLLHCIF
jgi:peroxiredoxin (alkyl hydroperoxide reductase subunit C)